MGTNPISPALPGNTRRYLLGYQCSSCAAPITTTPTREWWCGPVIPADADRPERRYYLGFPTDGDLDQRWVRVEDMDGQPPTVEYLGPSK